MTKDTMAQELFYNAHLPITSAKVLVDVLAQQALESLVHQKDKGFAGLALNRWFEARELLDKAQATIAEARKI